jgi:inhibitor of cysteine peptidase
MSTQTLTRDDQGSVVTANVGERLIIRLPESPATGYRWALEKSNESVLTLEKTAYEPSSTAGTGGGGQRTLTFLMKAMGTVLLQLKHWRSWEGDASITERFTLTIHVQE